MEITLTKIKENLISFNFDKLAKTELISLLNILNKLRAILLAQSISVSPIAARLSLEVSVAITVLASRVIIELNNKKDEFKAL